MYIYHSNKYKSQYINYNKIDTSRMAAHSIYNIYGKFGNLFKLKKKPSDMGQLFHHD